MEPRWVCACLMAGAGLLLALPLPERLRRIAWVGLAVAGAWNGFALSARPYNLVGSNLVHYYLGAKYPIHYADFYRMVQAARDTAQVGMRDLADPRDYVRAGKWARRAYYIDLMRARDQRFDPLEPLDSLAAHARYSGAIRAEADAILLRGLPADRIASFRRDVDASVGTMAGRSFVDDYGFNGSPFYVLLRRLDPSLYLPFDRRLGWTGLAGQFVLAIGFVWIVGSAIALSPWERVASIALLFASWDFIGYVLPGLVFGGVWIPVAVMAWAVGRDRPVTAGLAVAWAGLLKLFPFVLLLPALVRLVRSRLGPAEDPRSAASAMRLLATCVAATLVLGALAQLGGRTWVEFFHKIAAEFRGLDLRNDVSLGQSLAVLGVSRDSLLRPLLVLATLGLLAAAFFGDAAADRGVTRARRTLVLASATGLLLSSWNNYYAILPLVMLPFEARGRRLVPALVAGSFAVAFFLPEFDARILRGAPALHLLKLLPYWIAPVVMLARELRPATWTGRVRRSVTTLAQCLLLLTLAETARAGFSRSFERQADASLAGGDAAGAIALYRRGIQLVPGNAGAHASLAEALLLSGQPAAARAEFALAASLAPGDAVIRDNYGRLLMMQRDWDDAANQLDAARALHPDDEEVLRTLAMARDQQGRAAESRVLLRRARELDPDDARVAAALDGH